jgi:hypothetical protein
VLRFGITDSAGLDRPTTVFGRPRAIAIPVLWRALQEGTERHAEVCADAFNRMRVGKGVYKRTAPGRFDDVRAGVLAALREMLGPASPLTVHDVGVSDGTTSVELYDDLKRVWPEVHLVMSDAFDRITVVRREGSPWTCVLDADFEPIQYFSRRFVLAPDAPTRLPVNRLLLARVMRREAPRFREIAARLRAGGDGAAAPVGASVERIALVGRAAAGLLARDRGVRFIRHDIRRPMAGTFRFVRAMNVLNLGYFDEAAVREIVAHVRAAIEPGGAFLVGRCIDEEDGRTAATLFRRTAGGFEAAARFHEGSEIEKLVS